MSAGRELNFPMQISAGSCFLTLSKINQLQWILGSIWHFSSPCSEQQCGGRLSRGQASLLILVVSLQSSLQQVHIQFTNHTRLHFLCIFNFSHPTQPSLVTLRVRKVEKLFLQVVLDSCHSLSSQKSHFRLSFERLKYFLFVVSEPEIRSQKVYLRWKVSRPSVSVMLH